ncbi:hypothetical protein AM493_14320 [Flavobacterium akiainvivens]|uniref:Lipoprotein n=1 Tax=Flavobacterium akiainvivens TaxID=1202724 RepID=A0A0M9VIV1_9FLAO|nr:hypothetical protein [Flavobacterium akiainvivens]KOS07079.1 hypothetical protein AM493_14320 [Flavobacterium akiainvivens]SFQ58444.1 hypothetical protein SAMN05444144_1098 [Flavobacterium akiainvivens]
MKTTLLSLCVAALLTSCDGAFTHYITNTNQEVVDQLRSPSDSTFSLSVNRMTELVPKKKRIVVTTKKENTGAIAVTVNGEKRSIKTGHNVNNGLHTYYLSKINIKNGDSISVDWDSETFNFVVLDSAKPAINYYISAAKK